MPVAGLLERLGFVVQVIELLSDGVGQIGILARQVLPVNGSCPMTLVVYGVAYLFVTDVADMIS